MPTAGFPAGDMGFEDAVRDHLDAVATRDLDRFVGSVDDDVVVVMPSGQTLEGKPAVTEFHRDWFADPDWTMATALRRVRTSTGMGHALVEVDYDDVDPEGQPYHRTYLLGLLFELTGDRWLLVHDQNTFT